MGAAGFRYVMIYIYFTENARYCNVNAGYMFNIMNKIQEKFKQEFLLIITKKAQELLIMIELYSSHLTVSQQ